MGPIRTGHPSADEGEAVGGDRQLFPANKRRMPMVYLQITLKIAPANRPAAAGVFEKYKAPFLKRIAGAKSKELLIRDADVQVLHGFDTAEQANAYLKTRH
jgi:hypothetical protein